MSASDYAVYFPYGATSYPYSEAHPHKGNDRCNEFGVPVVIQGTQIGLTGFTGKVLPQSAAGAHLHIQEWNGNYANTRPPQNEFKPGIVANIDPNGTQGDGSFGKFVTIQNADGWNDSYCHLSRIDVKVGDIIGGTMPELANDGDIKLAFELVHNKNWTPGDVDYWTKAVKDNKLDPWKLVLAMRNSQQYIIDAYINEGDVQHLATLGIDARAAKDKFWKDGSRNFFKALPMNVKPYDGPELFVKEDI